MRLRERRARGQQKRALSGGGEARRARQGCGACIWVDPSHLVGGKLEAQIFEVTASLEAGRGRPGRPGPARRPARGAVPALQNRRRTKPP